MSNSWPADNFFQKKSHESADIFVCSELLNHDQTFSDFKKERLVFFKTIKMDVPYQFKKLENQGINVGTNSEPYFYEK